MTKDVSDGEEVNSEATQPMRLTRGAVVAVDELLGVPLRILDDGFIRLIDYTGDDRSVVQSPRVSYGAGTKRVHEHRALIRYLMRHSHPAQFEMCEVKFHVRVPLAVGRQWNRHRAAHVN